MVVAVLATVLEDMTCCASISFESFEQNKRFVLVCSKACAQTGLSVFLGLDGAGPSLLSESEACLRPRRPDLLLCFFLDEDCRFAGTG